MFDKQPNKPNKLKKHTIYLQKTFLDNDGYGRMH